MKTLAALLLALLSLTAACGDRKRAKPTAPPVDAGRPAPDAAPPPAFAAEEVRAGDGVTCARTAAGTVHCFGAGDDGALGLGAALSLDRPGAPVTGLADAKRIVLAGKAACALRATGEVACWGANAGRLGDGTADARREPAAMTGITGATGVALGATNGCVLVAGEARCSGDNSSGQLGAAAGVSPSLAPVATARGLAGVAELAVGEGAICARLEAGTVRCWGSNLDNRLGHRPLVEKKVPRSEKPVDATGLDSAIALTGEGGHFCAIRRGGEVYCWGANPHGQLGEGTQQARWVPTPVLGLTEVINVDVSASHSCAVTYSGKVYCWGKNSDGQLGDGTTDDKNRVTAVAGLPADITQVSAGAAHSCAVAKSGTVYCWGANRSGELGAGVKDERLGRPHVVLK